jgi:hypothetical protein
MPGSGNQQAPASLEPIRVLRMMDFIVAESDPPADALARP